ncbi:hypothetical protein [Streptomyces nitrosporeus]|uniref:hypothetical protein n=1 Tax=Streptomyces nitrosporeus TaxID=28894 RepID=UPI00399FD2E4
MVYVVSGRQSGQAGDAVIIRQVGKAHGVAGGAMLLGQGRASCGEAAVGGNQDDADTVTVGGRCR